MKESRREVARTIEDLLLCHATAIEHDGNGGDGRDEFEHEMKQLRPVVIRLDKKRGELKMEVEHLRVEIDARDTQLDRSGPVPHIEQAEAIRKHLKVQKDGIQNLQQTLIEDRELYASLPK